MNKHKLSCRITHHNPLHGTSSVNEHAHISSKQTATEAKWTHACITVQPHTAALVSLHQHL